MTTCDRCNRPCRGSAGDPKARIFRKAMKGLCTTCYVIDILKRLNADHGGMLLPNGPDPLRYQHVQEQFAAVMRAGNAQALPDEIDWDAVVTNWGDDKPKGGLFSS